MIVVHKLASQKLLKFDDLNKMVELENASKVGEANDKIYRLQPLALYTTVGFAVVATISLIAGLVHELMHKAQF